MVSWFALCMQRLGQRCVTPRFSILEKFLSTLLTVEKLFLRAHVIPHIPTYCRAISFIAFAVQRISSENQYVVNFMCGKIGYEAFIIFNLLTLSMG